MMPAAAGGAHAPKRAVSPIGSRGEVVSLVVAQVVNWAIDELCARRQNGMLEERLGARRKAKRFSAPPPDRMDHRDHRARSRCVIRHAAVPEANVPDQDAPGAERGLLRGRYLASR